MAKKAAFHNLGCKVNAYETEAMAEQLKRDGYEIVPFDVGADVYVINTCTVTNIADRKSRQMLRRAREMNPHAIVVAAGCYVEDSELDVKKDPIADIAVGNNEKSRLAELLRQYYRGLSGEERERYEPGAAVLTDKAGLPDDSEGKEKDHGASASLADKADLTGAGKGKETGAGRQTPPVNRRENINRVTSYDNLRISEAGEHTRAYIKIQDGCNQFCSYCMIPYVRGRVRSREKEDILQEARRLAEGGYRELVLTGIHISSYGLDFDYPGQNRQTPDAAEAETNVRLLELIKEAASVPGVERIRLGSLEPGIMTEDFVRSIADIPEICPQFHLSLQSGSNTVLERMRRKYRTDDYEAICKRIREAFSHPAITTDIITGFPGETAEESEETVRFAERIKFAKTHIFKYSARRGTKAAAMKEQIPESVKHARSAVLIELDRKNRREFADYYVSKELEVLFEEKKLFRGAMQWFGHTREALDVYLMGASEKKLSGSLVRCRVLRSVEDGSLLAEPVI